MAIDVCILKLLFKNVVINTLMLVTLVHYTFCTPLHMETLSFPKHIQINQKSLRKVIGFLSIFVGSLVTMSGVYCASDLFFISFWQ